MRTTLQILAGIALTGLSYAQVEDFDGATNEGGWQYNVGTTQIAATGGNPNGWLQSAALNQTQFYPRAITTMPSTVFHGDYRARGITQLTCDAKVDENTFGVSLQITLLLRNDGGTPLDLTDDCLIWKFYGSAPSAGSGWTSYVLDFDAQSMTAPSGWQLGHLGPGITNCSTDADVVWNNVITNVTDVEIWFGTPTTLVLGLTQTLRVGLDNIGISTDTGFDESCNGDGGDQMGCTDCPCGNNAPLGTIGGCTNSSGNSTRLLPSGSPSISVMDLRFEASGLPPSNTGVLTSGNSLAPANMSNPCFGLNSGVTSVTLDGLRCAVQGVLRHGVRPADANGDIGVTTNGWGTPNGFFNFGAFVAGDTKHFQIIHRELAASVCQTGQSTSQAVSATFAP